MKYTIYDRFSRKYLLVLEPQSHGATQIIPERGKAANKINSVHIMLFTWFTNRTTPFYNDSQPISWIRVDWLYAKN
jgi:hypothetical protein